MMWVKLWNYTFCKHGDHCLVKFVFHEVSSWSRGRVNLQNPKAIWSRCKVCSQNRNWFVEFFSRLGGYLSSSLCAICSQQVGCHGSPSFSILCHSDTVIIWHFCPFLDVIRPHCSRSPSSSSTIYPSFHQQSLYPISSYYMSKILTFPFLIIIIMCHL